MFERYTERARHVIFVARVEASNLGSMAVETEHLLLGLLQDDNLLNRFGSPSSVERVRVKIKQRLGPKDGPSIDLPLSIECERVLAYAAQEAERLNHPHIGTEHLLLGILGQDLCGTAQILKEVGFDLGNVREQLARSTT